MGNISRSLGLKIKELRRARKLTQSELAEKIDVDSKYLSRIETGLSSPSLNTLEKIAVVLQIDIAQLFNFVEYKQRDEIIALLHEKINLYSLNNLKILSEFTKILDSIK